MDRPFRVPCNRRLFKTSAAWSLPPRATGSCDLLLRHVRTTDAEAVNALLASYGYCGVAGKDGAGSMTATIEVAEDAEAPIDRDRLFRFVEELYDLRNPTAEDIGEALDAIQA